MRSLVFLCALLFLFAASAGAIETCKHGSGGGNPACNGRIDRCAPTEKCCNANKLNAACVPSSSTCPPAVECTQVQCGTQGGSPFYCPVDYFCCDVITNLCKPNGQVC
jgi:hypothetical protein